MIDQQPKFAVSQARGPAVFKASSSGAVKSFRACKRHVLVFVAAMMAQPAAGQSELSTYGQNWQSTTRVDVNAAYELLSQNHPGMVDPANTDFPA